MTESEWLQCNDVDELLAYEKEYRHNAFSQRKKRLAATACCRRIWHLFHDERAYHAIQVAERYCDGKATDKELWAASLAASDAREEYEQPHHNAMKTAAFASDVSVWDCFDFAANVETAYCPPAEQESQKAVIRRWQVHIFKDVFNPYYRLRDLRGELVVPSPVAPDWLSWKDGLVVALAQTAYDNRILPSGELEFGRLGVLADALEEAGCDDAELLNHLRSPGPHVRGCFVVDLCLSLS